MLGSLLSCRQDGAEAIALPSPPRLQKSLEHLDSSTTKISVIVDQLAPPLERTPPPTLLHMLGPSAQRQRQLRISLVSPAVATFPNRYSIRTVRCPIGYVLDGLGCPEDIQSVLLGKKNSPHVTIVFAGTVVEEGTPTPPPPPCPGCLLLCMQHAISEVS
jgi:hypothetical protein